MAAPPHIDPPLLAPTLSALPEPPRPALDRLRTMGFRSVQLSANQPEMRPREMDQSARRGLLATLRRVELQLAGIDLWIPAEHFRDPAHLDRALGAILAAIGLAADLERCPLSLTLPHVTAAAGAGVAGTGSNDALTAIIHEAHRHGVALADHAIASEAGDDDDLIGIGIDPAALLGSGRDPAEAVTTHSRRIISARLSDLSTAGMRLPPGRADGRLDLRGYQVALSVVGYQRPVVADARHWPQPWVDLSHTADLWTTVA